MGIVALKYQLPSTEKIIKKEKFQICFPSLCLFSWRFETLAHFEAISGVRFHALCIMSTSKYY